MLKVKIPGKLILTGEWSILEPNNTALSLAVNKFVTVKLSLLKIAEKYSSILPAFAKTCPDAKTIIVLTSKDINIKNIILTYKNTANKLCYKTDLSKEEKNKLNLVYKSIEITLKYLSENNRKFKSFKLNISSQISKIKTKDNSYKKLGLGSSGAIVVAIIAGILKLNKYKISKINLFKLSSIAHYLAQNKIGSAIDIATSVYQSPIIYQKFDDNWLEKNLDKNSLNEIIKTDWPNLKIKKVKLPKNLNILVGYCGQSSSTTEIIKQTKRLKDLNPDFYNGIIKNINIIVLKLVKILRSKKTKINKIDQIKFINLIKQNRILLKNLNPKLETPELKTLIELATTKEVVAKFSGAGAGDCCLAISFDKKAINKIKKEWENAGFYVPKIGFLN